MTGAKGWSWLAAGVLVIASLAGSAPARAHATDPPELKGDSSIVHACVGTRAGVLTLVDAETGECRFGQTATHWGLTGPAGSPATNTTELTRV